MRKIRWAMFLITGFVAVPFAGCGGTGDDGGDGGATADGGADAGGGGGGDAGVDSGVKLESWSFVVISDTHTRLPGNPDDGLYDNQKNLDNLAGAVANVNTKYAGADFLAVTGDLVGALFSENADDYLAGNENPAEKWKELMGGLNIPFYPALGNHDYQKSYDADIDEGITTDNIESIEAVWKKVLGIEPYYSFVHKGVRMIFLNANRGAARTEVCAGETVEAFCTGSFDDAQMTWLDAELAEGGPAILFLHHPPKTDSETAFFSAAPGFLVAEGDRFYDVSGTYADSILAIFVGHGHIWERDRLHKKIPVYETGPVGDTGGNAENIHLVDVDPDGPSINVTIGREGVKYYSDNR